MPVFELNGKKVIYGLDQEDGKVLIDAEDVAEALGYSAEVVDNIADGAAVDVVAEISAVVDRQFGPEGDIYQTEHNGHILRYCGTKREGQDDIPIIEGKACLSDYLKMLGVETNSDTWVTWADLHNFLLTRLANIHCERTLLDGIPVRYQKDFAGNETVYSVNDIIDSIDDGETPMPYDDGWIDETGARKLIKIMRPAWRVFLTTGKTPGQEALSAMLKADDEEAA